MAKGARCAARNRGTLLYAAGARERAAAYSRKCFAMVMLTWREARRFERALAALGSCEGWIPTTDRLPEKPGKTKYEYVECLIFLQGRNPHAPMELRSIRFGTTRSTTISLRTDCATHWRPPSPPER